MDRLMTNIQQFKAGNEDHNLTVKTTLQVALLKRCALTSVEFVKCLCKKEWVEVIMEFIGKYLSGCNLTVLFELNVITGIQYCKD